MCRRLMGRSHHCLALLVFLAAALLPATASAQSARHIFIGARVSVDIQRHPTIRERGAVDPPDLSGVGLSGSVVGGLFLDPRVSVRLEQGWSTERRAAAVTSQVSAFGPVTTTSLDQQSRIATSLVMAGYHLASDRSTRLVLLAGVNVARERVRTRIDLEVGLPPIVEFPAGLPLPGFDDLHSDRTRTAYRVGVALGTDAEWSLSRRLTLSAGVRALTFGGALGLQPGVAVRWTL